MTSTIPQINYSNYIIPGDFVTERRGSGLRGNEFYILKSKDGTEWVHLTDPRKNKERFCGFLYLQNAQLNEVVPAENKMSKYRGDIIYISKYCGENRPNMLQAAEAVSELLNIGYKDLQMCTNMRIVDKKLYLFDTEKSSFYAKVHDQIDSFSALHDAIKSSVK